jgi:cytochrome c nitrite reductase small subunit
LHIVHHRCTGGSINAKTMKKLLPFLAFASLGLVLGLGAFTASHAKGLSYLKDDPAACVNCHVMQDQYDSWSHSSHREWATCNECHMPHDPVGKYYRKALNGWNHSVKFTSGDFPDPIMIGERNKEVALENCLNCHQNMVNDMLRRTDGHRDELRCTECHGNVGHLGVG